MRQAPRAGEHKTLAEVERYTKAASQKVMAVAMAKMAPEKVCNPKLQTGLLTHWKSREVVRPRGIEPLFPP